MRIAAGAAVLLAAFAGQGTARAEKLPAAQQRLFDDFGTFTDATMDDHGVARLSLWEPHVRYVTPRESEDKRKALVFLIRQASDAGRQVVIRYDGARGRLNKATGTLDYPLCLILLDSTRFEPSQPCKDEASAPPTNFEAALTLARAQTSSGNYEAARALLGRFAAPQDVAAKKLFLWVRAQNEDGLAASAPPASPEADQATAAALADQRTLATLEPDDVEHQFEIAGSLLELGGYSEARSAYEAILARWPEEDYRVSVRLGALYRAQGDYRKALQALDDLLARKGPQQGMKFHYHRGWTLSLLGRFDEAVRELSDGIEQQPDYESAYLRRACAHASLGELKVALADVEQASTLVDVVAGNRDSKPFRDVKDDVAALRERLRTAIARGDGKPLAGACTGPDWGRYEHPRPRSPLLPSA